MSRRSTFLIAALIALSAASTACRSTWRSPVGIDSTVYQSETHQLVESDRGELHLVVPSKAETGAFLIVGEGASAMIYATEEIARRTFRLVPVTPGRVATGELQNPRFFATLAEAGAELGNHGIFVDGEVKWFGEAPDGERTIVAISPDRLVRGQFDFVESVGTWTDGASWFTGAPGEGALIVEEGAPMAPRASVVRLGREARQVEPQWSTLLEGPIPPDDVHLYAERVSPIARKTGADLYVTIWNGRVYIGSTETITDRGVPFVLGAHPLAVGGTAREIEEEMLGLVALQHGKPLAAFGFFDPGDTDIHDSGRAASYGLLELAAAGGYYPFARKTLLGEGPVSGVRRSNHARALYRVGASEARAEGVKAYDELLALSDARGFVAQGDAAMLVAFIDASNSHWKTAAAVAAQAAESYKKANDDIRTAHSELFGGEAAVIGGNVESAEQLANKARSRYYHGNAPYQSAMTEVSLAHVLLRGGDIDQAKTMADYASRRFASTGDEVAKNRADLALARVASDVSGIEKGLVIAVEQGDEVGALDAVTSLIEARGVPDAARRTEFLLTIARGYPLLVEPLLRLRAATAATKLCEAAETSSTEVAPSDASNVRRLCGKELDLRASAPVVSPNTIYQQLERGDYDAAMRLLDSIDMPKDPGALAVVGMARNLAGREPAETIHAELLPVFTDAEPSVRWKLLKTAASQAERVGAQELAARWGADAIDAVKADQSLDNPIATRGEIALEQVARLVRMERVLAASNGATYAVTGMVATEPSQKAIKARIAGYGAVAAQNAGATSDVAELRKIATDALDGATAVTIADARSSTAWFASRRGADKLAKEELEGARKAFEATPPAERSAVVAARIALVEGWNELQNDKPTAAFKKVSLFFDNPGTDPQVAADLWSLTLATAPSEELRQGFVDRLMRVGTQLREVAIGVAALYHLEAGATAKALEIARTVDDPGPDPTARLALELRSRVLGGEAVPQRWVRRLGETTQHGIIGILAATQFSESPRETGAAWAKRRLEQRGLTSVERARAELVSEIATPSSKDPARTSRLQERLEKALETRDASKIVPAVVDRVDDLLASGRPGAAFTVLDRTETWFSQVDGGAARIARLRLASEVANLRPVRALNVSGDALDAAGKGSEETKARIYLQVARNDLILGLRHRAEEHLRTARQAASAAGERGLEREVDSIADDFGLVVGP